MIAFLYCVTFATLPVLLTGTFTNQRLRFFCKPLLVLLFLCVMATLPGFALTGLFSWYPKGEDMFIYTQSENILRGIEGSGMVLLAMMPLWLAYTAVEVRRSRQLAS